jgi:hypothetical protein
MDAGEAAVQAAAITVIGTVLVGSLALIGSLFGPWLKEVVSGRAVREEARRARVRELLVRLDALLVEHWRADASKDLARFDLAVFEGRTVTNELALLLTESEEALAQAVVQISREMVGGWGKPPEGRTDREGALLAALGQLSRDWATGSPATFGRRWSPARWDELVERNLREMTDRGPTA